MIRFIISYFIIIGRLFCILMFEEGKTWLLFINIGDVDYVDRYGRACNVIIIGYTMIIVIVTILC